MRKFLSTVLALCMVLALGVPAFAATSVDVSGGQGSVPVIVNADAAKFSVTVPTSLPITIDEDGNPTTVPQTITNNGSGPVKITDLRLQDVSPWTSVDYDTNYNKMASDKVGTKHLALRTGEAVSNANNAAYKDTNKLEKSTGVDPKRITFTESNWSVIAGNGGTLHVKYDPYIPVQNEQLTNVTVAYLIFTIAWDTVTTE